MGGRSAPGAADETVQAMRPGRNTRRVRRVSGVVPRGSRSRSRTPPSEPGSMRASSSTDVVRSMASNAGLPPGDPSGPALTGAAGAGTGELVGVLSAVPSGAATGQVAALDVRNLPERDPLAVRPHDAHVLPQTPGGRARPEPREDCAVPGPALSVPGQRGTEVHVSLGAANPGRPELSGDAPPVGLPLCEQPLSERPSEVLAGPALPALPAEVPPGELPLRGLDGSGVDQPVGAESAGCSDPPREPTPRVRPPPREQPSQVLPPVPGDPEADVPALPALPAEVPPGELPVRGLDGSGVDQPAGAECAGCSDPPREPIPRVRPPPREQPSHVLPPVPGDPEADVPDVPVDRRVSK